MRGVGSASRATSSRVAFGRAVDGSSASFGVRHRQRVLALAGVLAPILFAAVVAFLSVVQYDFARELGWDPIRRTAAGWPSILALGDLGWLLTATLALCSVLGVAFAVGLYRATKGSPWNAAGAATLAVLAVAVGLEAFTTDPPGFPGPPTWHGEIHDAAYPVVVLSALAAPVLFAVGLARQPGWRRHAGVSLAAAAVLFATLVLQVERSYAQLLEYPFFATLLLWLELLALRLLRLTRSDERA